MDRKYDILIIGGGAVGCAAAYTLARYDLRVGLLERCPDVCMGTSGKNSAVVHAGFNNRPGSLMARLCVEGNRGFAALCRTLDVPYRKTGKLVVAFDEGDREILRSLMENGRKNGCTGLSLVDAAQMRALVPGVGGIGAMLSADTAVLNPFLYTIHLAQAACLNGADILLNREVTGIRPVPEGVRVTTGGEEFTCGLLVNSAGTDADRGAALAGDGRFRIHPSRGQYFILDKEAARHAPLPVYPTPRKGVGGLGVHLTTTIDGNVLIGPSAEYVDGREETATTAQVMEQLLAEAAQLLPALHRGMVIGAYAGIRAKLVEKGQENFGDFVIEESPLVPGLINLVGIESPGLTASMPIARLVRDIIAAKRPLAEKKDFIAEYRGIPAARDMTPEELDARIRENPDYGEIVCRCERVSRAEILRALDNPLGVRSLTGIKNRVRVMTGRCNGGYCLTKLADILQDRGLAPEEIAYRVPGDAPFTGRVK